MHRASQDVEFERRFVVGRMPAEVRAVRSCLMVAGYFVVDGDLSLRVRVRTEANLALAAGDLAAERAVLEEFATVFASAAMTAKAPRGAGVRYEAERDLDPGVALELVRRAPHVVSKLRRDLGEGWTVDEFIGDNLGLITAELERDRPVVDPRVPSWVVGEVTAVEAFSSGHLALAPFSTWRGPGL